jgi:metallo-beta-lactamase class B
MRSTRTAWVALAAMLTAAATSRAAELKADPPKKCEPCDEWNAPREPFRVFGNTYYVGTAGLSSILVTSSDGLVLLDGGLSQSAPLIDASIRKLGFRTEDVRLIVNSHAHYDHAGGIAALQRVSGATVAASRSGAWAIEHGDAPDDDPQRGFGHAAMAFPAVAKVRVVKDGETLTVGPIALTAHLTPGHTPGSTAWTWRSCEEARCLDMVYADSFSPVSAPGFRFTGDATHPSLEASFRRSIETVAALPCGILLAPHPSFIAIDDKLAAWKADPAKNPFIDDDACAAYAAAATQRLDQRIAEERGSPVPK